MLKKTKDLEERRRLLSALTKEEKKLLFDLYFQQGSKHGAQGWDVNHSVSTRRWHYVDYVLLYTYACELHASRVLELGCSAGWLIKALRETGVEAWGVDVSPWIVSKADSAIKDFIHIVDLDLENIPFNDSFFDMVVGTQILEHLLNLSHVINEVKRVLKQEGFALFVIPKPMAPWALDDITHVNIWDESTWINILQRAGFKLYDIDVNCEKLMKGYKDLIFKLPPHNIKTRILRFIPSLRVGKLIAHVYIHLKRILYKQWQNLSRDNHIFLLQKIAP